MIVPMKKVHLVALKDDQEKLMVNLQKCGELMLIASSEASEPVDTYSEENIIQRTEKSLKFLKKYQEKQKLFGNFQEVSYSDFTNLDPKREERLTKVEETEEGIAKLRSENDAVKESVLFLSVWQDFDIPLNKLDSSRSVIWHLGFVEAKNQNRVQELMAETGSEIQFFGQGSEGQALAFANYIDDDAGVMEKMRIMGFNEIKLPKDSRTVAEMISEKEGQISANNQEIKTLMQKMREFSSEINDLKLLNDQISSLKEIKEAPVLRTVETVYLEGWVRSDRIKPLKTAIEEVTEFYDLELFDPLPEENPPTCTKNNRFVESFEVITNMLGVPNSKEIDPNPVMSIWYWVIFGIMMGDVGYGLLMAIIMFLLIKLTHPKGNGLKLMKVLFFCSITTIIWGVLFGSYFGATWHPILMEPMVDPLKMLILSLIIGGIHIISGLLIKAYSNIRQKKYLAAVADQFSWIMIIAGAGMLFMPALATVGKIVALTGAGLILLLAGRAAKNPVAKLGLGLYSLYGISNYLSDILSYSRILALSLSTAVIAMVMNTLAGMLQTSIIGIFFSLIVYIVGHSFNLVMGLLSAFVHASRLQYIEFFNKFYEGGGYEFKPLDLKLKYVNQVNMKE
ncbi:MAG TPA: V-type ATP synthase subunit I [Acholeplasmatales bacterium]|nr:V-type ATP synthase subunit I [Acholeplasmatales bacterium]